MKRLINKNKYYYDLENNNDNKKLNHNKYFIKK